MYAPSGPVLAGDPVPVKVELEKPLTNVVQDRKDIRKVSRHLILCNSTLTCLAEHSMSSMPH